MTLKAFSLQAMQNHHADDFDEVPPIRMAFFALMVCHTLLKVYVLF